ncbi:MAG: HAD-IA family hydrolase [Verrucomicrobia subdivision 3 bacterium]|nr:HAD-IA family hydrolase [Limisphaerales bacterium]
MKSNEIRAVTLDAAGTLLEPWPSVGDVYARVAEECGIGPVSPVLLNRQFGDAWKTKNQFDYSKLAWRKLVQKAFAGLASLKPAFFDQLYDEFAQPRCWRVFSDVPPALERFRGRGLKLAVISNWDERLRPLLEHIGLAPYFDAIVVSCEVGFLKPSQQIFAHAAAALKVPANQILHVGDSMTEDAQGAQAAAFHAVLLDRTGIAEKSVKNLARILE